MGKKNNPEGQLSFWDIEIPTSSNIVEKATEEVIRVVKGITDKQEQIIEKYRVIEQLNRVIQYAGGGVGIELKNDNGFNTIYVNKVGEEEFVTLTQVPVQPIDKIITAKEEYEINEIQTIRLEDLKQKYKIKSYIKRNGDKNIIVKLNEKVISINPQGWILEYKEAIYHENEVIKFKENDIEYKVGDYVEALHGNEKIMGEIVKKYENQDSFNIVWNRKHSAFHKSKILRKVS